MNFERLLIKEYKHWDVFLHKNQYYLGRTYLWAKRNDALDFLEMDQCEKDEFFRAGQDINSAIARLFSPDLMNYASLANEARHLHVHFIPRYASRREFENISFIDKNFGKNYAPYDHKFKVPDKTLIKLKKTIQVML